MDELDTGPGWIQRHRTFVRERLALHIAAAPVDKVARFDRVLADNRERSRHAGLEARWTEEQADAALFVACGLRLAMLELATRGALTGPQASLVVGTIAETEDFIVALCEGVPPAATESTG